MNQPTLTQISKNISYLNSNLLSKPPQTDSEYLIHILVISCTDSLMSRLPTWRRGKNSQAQSDKMILKEIQELTVFSIWYFDVTEIE